MSGKKIFMMILVGVIFLLPGLFLLWSMILGVPREIEAGVVFVLALFLVGTFLEIGILAEME